MSDTLKMPLYQAGHGDARVKPLEWVKKGDFLYRADAPFDTTYWVNTLSSMWIGSDDWQAAVDPKAAAQADYEARILSALEAAQPMPEPIPEYQASAADDTNSGVGYHSKPEPSEDVASLVQRVANAMEALEPFEESILAVPGLDDALTEMIEALDAALNVGIRRHADDFQRLSEENAEYKRRSELNPLAGMSWNGFNIWGDEKSIKEVRRIEHRSAQLEQFSGAFDERKKALSEENATLRKALRGMFCPRPANDRPTYGEWDVSDCLNAGECGCLAGSALAQGGET